MITTVGELRELLAQENPDAPLRIQTHAGELEGLNQVTEIAGRVVLQGLVGRKEQLGHITRGNRTETHVLNTE